MAAATADVVASGGSALTTCTRCPARASSTAQVSPMTPPPTTVTSCGVDFAALCGEIHSISSSRLLLRVGRGVGRRRLHVADAVLLHRLPDDTAVELVPLGQRHQRAADDRL